MTRPLITASELAIDLATATPPRVLDVRWVLGQSTQREAFEQGHVPGAVYVDLDTELAEAPGAGGRHPLPAEADFVAAMRRAGIDDTDTVVVYDGGPATSAARAWWLLRRFGHADVLVLDGGLAAWTAEGLPLQTGPAAEGSGSFTARESLAPVLEIDDVLPFAESGVLLDARDIERYRGEIEPVDPVAGHIPGAVSAQTKDNVGPDGRFLSPEQLRQRFEALGVTEDTEVGVYCGSGVTAAHETLALEIAGFPARLFPGSWSAWVHSGDRPVATGA